MPIQSDDIKLLKSAVMADVPEGGGGATGVEIIDGQSNNIFNDISTDDRAAGDFALRKLFGVAHTDDTDTLLGAGFVVLQPPEDPNVHLTVFETDGWFDDRTNAVADVENYLVKGPRLLCRIQDTHYAGTQILQLYNPQPGESFPTAGDTVVVRNPNGQEQYVRALKVTLSEAIVIVDEGGPMVINLASCELDQPLEFDVLGLSVRRVAPSVTSTATVFSTVPAAGAVFHGVKPLADEAAIGDRTVFVEGGIFTNLVPASTVPTPVTDVYPMVQRPTLSRTAAAPLAVSTSAVALTAGTVLQLPTAAEPATLTMVHGATSFTSNLGGDLLQGSTVVGSIDWAGRTITMAGTAPNFGTATNAITYKPATVVGATAHSLGIVVTAASQSSALVLALEPPPAPGTLILSSMAQSRWYDLVEDGSGKLSGGDSSYGSGTLSFVTGSVAASMGALPDVGSTIVASWGEADSARTATGTPTRAWADLALPDQPDGNATVAWSRGATNYSATVAPDGSVTGPAQARPLARVPGGGYLLPFSPDTLPDGPFTVTYNSQTETAAFTNGGGGAYTLTGAPIAPGSVRFQVLGTSGSDTRVYRCYSDGTLVYAEGVGVIGTVNNTTGAMLLNGAGTQDVTTWVNTRVERFMGSPTGLVGPTHYIRKTSSTQTYTLDLDGVIQIGYLPSTGATAKSEEITPSWKIDMAPPVGLSLVTSDAAFVWAGVVHFVRASVVYKSWNSATGATSAVGAASSEGVITLGSTAPGASNTITWANAAHDARGGLDVLGGVFRVPSAPIQAGQFQLQAGAQVGSANSGGVISGDFDGLVDSQRGVVIWTVDGIGPGEDDGTPVRADEVTYNAVYLSYVPLDQDLLGVNTTRLPLDGRVPIYRAGGQVVVHNTLTTALPNPLTKGTTYDLGRERIAAVTVRDATGVRVSGTLYTVDFNAGEILVPVDSDITALVQPLTVHHRIEDELLVLQADISGELKLAATLTHAYPAGTSFVSSKLRLGDRFARVFNHMDRTTWAGSWDSTAAGSETAANFNAVDYPIVTSNRGAITERWSVRFTTTTLVNVIGEGVGQVLTGVSITSAIEAINPQTGAEYFSIPPTGWGGGWSAGNVLLFETQAAGGPAWVARAVMPGAPTVADDSAVIAFRADVDQP